MSVHIILRLSLMLVVAFLGWEVGPALSGQAFLAGVPVGAERYPPIMALVGALVGFFAAPYLAVLPCRALRRRLKAVPTRPLIMGVLGLLLGLIAAALLTRPLSLLPGALGDVSPSLAAAILGALGAMTLVIRDRDILAVARSLMGGDAARRGRQIVLLDTSVIIDGRLPEICQAGFVGGTMIVPRFILEELQYIADSPDVLRRNRGRRGLDMLNKLQKDGSVPLEISNMDASGIREVDGKLVKIAQDLDCPILTNDYNLNRVAELQGVPVLNINELANAVRAVVLPGETLRLQIIQEGKEAGQGVGYLDDGTMVVIEDGRRSMNLTVDVVVTRVLQTVAGRMIFGQIEQVRR